MGRGWGGLGPPIVLTGTFNLVSGHALRAALWLIVFISVWYSLIPRRPRSFEVARWRGREVKGPRTTSDVWESESFWRLARKTRKIILNFCQSLKPEDVSWWSLPLENLAQFLVVLKMEKKWRLELKFQTRKTEHRVWTVLLVNTKRTQIFYYETFCCHLFCFCTWTAVCILCKQLRTTNQKAEVSISDDRGRLNWTAWISWNLGWERLNTCTNRFTSLYENTTTILLFAIVVVLSFPGAIC